jgi:hypothetical protein
MGKKDLKEQNKDLEIHVVDLINRFDPSETGKYTKFLTKILKDKLDERKLCEKQKKGNIRTLNRFNVNEIMDFHADNIGGFKAPVGLNDLEDILINYLLELYGSENMENLISFHKHTQENRIVGKDVNSYNGWGEINKEVLLATLKQNQKLLEKQVQKVVDTEEWLIIRPLTVEASLTYGSGTKWCTASRYNKEYFYRYSRNGVLCYVINKINGDKFGVYYDVESKEFSLWDATDKRIDSVESTIPSDLITKLYKFMKNEKRNYEYFSEVEKLKCDEFDDEPDEAVVVEEQEPDMGLVQFPPNGMIEVAVPSPIPNITEHNTQLA